MKKIIRITIGTIITICGLAATAFIGSLISKGNLLWLPLAIAAGGLAVAGIRVGKGDRIRDILRDLLFVLVRAH